MTKFNAKPNKIRTPHPATRNSQPATRNPQLATRTPQPATRIAYIIGQLTKGGAEGQLYELLRHIDRERFHPLVCSLSEGGYWAGKIRELGIEVVELKWKSHYDISRLFKLCRILKKWKPDIVQTTMWSANSYGRIAAKLAGVPKIIASERVLDRNKTTLQIWVDRILDTFTARYIVNSYGISDYLSSGRQRLSQDKIAVIHNGVDIERFNPSIDRRKQSCQSIDTNDDENQIPSPPPFLAKGGRGDFQKKKREELGIKSDERIIGIIGRLSPQKNHKLFLDASKIVADRLPSVRFLIAGKGELRDYLEDYARRLGISDRVIFAGLRNDIPELICIIDLLVLSSDYEGLPNVILEAMAAAKPVVAADIEGCSEVVANNETGILVPPGRQDKLAEAILKILMDDTLAESMGRSGRLRVEKEFSMEKMVRDTEMLYMEVMG